MITSSYNYLSKWSNKNAYVGRLQEWLYQQLITAKLNSFLGYTIVLGLVVVISIAAALMGFKGVFLLLVAIFALPLVLLVFLNLEVGFYLTVFCSFFINFARKYTDFTIGTMLDGLLILMLLGLCYKQLKARDFRIATSGLSIAIYAWIGYNLLQVLNPISPSLEGWSVAVRTLSLWLVSYFVAFHVFDSLKKIQRFTWFVIIMMLISAFYGFKQEFIGFSNQEMAWLYADPLRFQLYFTWSRLRIFSFFSDPTSLGIAMAYTSVLCLILATGKITNRWERPFLLTAALLMLIAMGYTGSRTPVLLITAGIVFYVLLNFTKEAVIVASILGIIGAGLILKSTSNPVIFRLQSAFSPQDDSSMQLRLRNQKYIQPFIQAHPFGTGLGSVGIWGKRFNTNSWLSGFAPDSAYVRVAIECGWVGLIIYLAMFFVALWTAIYYYFRVKSPTIKLLYLAFANVIFLVTVANYPQEASYMLPTNLVFNGILAAVARLKDFDENFQS